MIKTVLLANILGLPGELGVTALILLSPEAVGTTPFGVSLACAASIFFSLNCLGAIIYKETS